MRRASRLAFLPWALLLCLLGATAMRAGPAPAPTGGESREILVMLHLAPDHFRPNMSYGGDYGDGQTNTARRQIALRVARENGLTILQNGWPMPLMGIDCYVMRVPAKLSLDDAIARVSRDPRVA